MLKAGERAPEFSLPDHDGREVSLTSLLNAGALLLCFFSGFPNPTSLVAPRKVSELHQELHRRGLVVAAVSARIPARLRSLRDRYQLPYVLLSDPQKSVARMYECAGLLGVRRGTYLISRGRTILGAVADPFNLARHMDFMRAAPEVVLGTPVPF